jgi:N6-adenosine-specific RNA methylase IME4
MRGMNDVLKIVDVENYAKRIGAAWRRCAEGIIETGKILIQAKADLDHGEWLALFDGRAPFKPRVAQCLMEIARDPRLVNAQTIALLPAEWSTIHSLSKLDDDAFESALAARATGAEIRQAAKAEKRGERERDLGAKIAALPDKKFGIIYADPPWRFEPYSRETGMDRAADNHYPTQSYAEIVKLDVASLAADDSVLFLWATVPMLPEALVVMKAWRFEYRSHFIWAKDRPGTGYWNRNAHELLLVGVKGDIPAPAPGTQSPSLIEGRVGKHSAKPEAFLELIEAYFPTLPKIELYRRGPSRKNWTAWGNQAEETAA